MAKRGLGKGLDALFNDTNASAIEENNLVELKINEIEPNKDQPRKLFDSEQLELLSESIKEHGVIQPIIVTKGENGFYTIIAGERRWRASKIAGLKTIPAVVRSYDEQKIMEVALVENLQREDLNPIEEAEGYKRLMDDFGFTQERVSEIIGKSRPAIANVLRLLTLSEGIKQHVRGGKLSSGHARTLLSVENQADRIVLAEKVITEEMSVRELEKYIKSLKREKPAKKEREFDAEIKDMENNLSSRIGTKVKIINGQKKGKIEIEYYGNDDLERILTIIGEKR